MTEEERDFPASDEAGAAQGEARRFSFDQMVACETCLRANPPTRMNCLYCGAALPVTDESARLLRPTLKQLEEWEQGFNIVLPAQGGAAIPAGAALDEAASLLRLDRERLKSMLDATGPLPLARAATAVEAGLIETRLGALGLGVAVVSDESLSMTTSPLRVRTLDIRDDLLKAPAGAGQEEVSLPVSEVVLLVVGRIYTKRIEVAERRGRLKSQGEVVEARELATDEAVLDVYAASEAAGWRINADNFDYTCLGARKTLLARDNFVTLVETLRERAPSALYDESYVSVRHLLASSWPLTERAESGGLKRGVSGRLNTEAVTLVSNEAQFTRYGRLLRHLCVSVRP